MDQFPEQSWTRFLALGDSLTAGRGDFGADGATIGWAQRLAGILSERTGTRCRLTNLAFDGANVAAVLGQQLPLVPGPGGNRPDLASVTVGMNDIRVRDFFPDRFAADLRRLLDALAETGATVLTCTLPDVSGVVALPAEYVGIARQRLTQASEIIRGEAARSGARCLDVWAMQVEGQPELFTSDRLHPNAAGHRVLARAFADLLLPG
jgi:lysophospholipase L1-like esterase